MAVAKSGVGVNIGAGASILNPRSLSDLKCDKLLGQNRPSNSWYETILSGPNGEKLCMLVPF